MEFHDNQMLFIEISDRIRRTFPGLPMERTLKSIVYVEKGGTSDVDNGEAEGAMERLLNEPDHWEDRVEKRTLSEN